MPSARILIADDEPNILMLTSQILEGAGDTILKATNGQEAIEMAMSEKPDLILLDIRMPFFSGFWFCDAFKQRPQTKNIPVVVISALTGEEDIQKAFRMGAVGYVKKPFQSEELLETIAKAIA